MTENGIIELKSTGERQVGKTLDEIEQRHRLRYYFASFFIDCHPKFYGRQVNVADIGCGIGYGSYIIASTLRKLNKVDSYDVAEDALAFARQNYQHDKINFLQQSCKADDLLSNMIFNNNKYDAIVSFEFLEHLDLEESFKTLYILLESTGLFISSFPLNNHSPFHKIIFTQEEIEQYYQTAISHCTNKKKISHRFLQDGCYHVYVIEDE